MNTNFRRHVITTALLLAGAASTSAWAGARDDLRSFTNGLRGLDGQFAQQVFDSRGRVKESSSGRVALSAPRLYNLLTDLREEDNVIIENSWTLHPMMRIVGNIKTSLKQYPPIEPGTPDPYTPPTQ